MALKKAIGTLSGVDDQPAISGLSEYLVASVKRVRSGESGLLPVLLGLAGLVIFFQLKSSAFLSSGNLTNLLTQGSTFILLGMAEVWVLLLGDIDLSTGYIAGIGATVTAIVVVGPYDYHWWLAMVLGVLCSTAIGALHGALIIKFKLPAFIVTLAGLLGWEGVLIYLVDSHGQGGTIPITNKQLYDLVNANLNPAAGWIFTIVVIVFFAGFVILRDRRRRINRLMTPPLIITFLKVAVIAAAGVTLVMVCNTNRSHFAVIRGIPYAVPIVGFFLAAWSFILSRTKFGRYVYAMGGNREAARRAGVSLGWNRLFVFMLSGFTAGVAGLIYASRLGGVSDNIDGGTLVLYAVAAAVIGGTSLFGGRGKMVHALVGGLVIATIYNGMGLIGLSAAAQYMVTALVLLVAVVIDSVARRGAPGN
jgi:D-xylose transport system permease protein